MQAVSPGWKKLKSESSVVSHKFVEKILEVLPPLAPPTEGGEVLGIPRVSSPLMGEDRWEWRAGLCLGTSETRY
jgi:hypothetical protein